MLSLNNLIGFGSGGVTPGSVAFIGTTIDTTVGAPQTFTGVSIGAADATRRVIVVIHGSGTGGAVTAVTIGGISATIHASAVDVDDRSCIVSAAVPTGTTATIVVTYTGSAWDEMGIAVFRAINLVSGTPHATATDTVDVVSMSINIPTNGILVAGCINNTSAGMTTVGVTENYDLAIGDDQMAGGCATGLPAQTNRTVSFDGSSSQANGVAASWA